MHRFQVYWFDSNDERASVAVTVRLLVSMIDSIVIHFNGRVPYEINGRSRVIADNLLFDNLRDFRECFYCFLTLIYQRANCLLAVNDNIIRRKCFFFFSKIFTVYLIHQLF